MIRQVHATKADETEIDTFFGKMLAPRLNFEERRGYEEEKKKDVCVWRISMGMTMRPHAGTSFVSGTLA